jgi:hypothetical protein
MCGNCRLCGQERVLRDSHFLPKAAYRLIRKVSGESPVIATRGLIRATDAQIHQHLLCEECEQRFSRSEQYTLSQCCRGSRFRLRELLDTLAPWQAHPDPELVPYQTAGATDLDVPTLVYFAASLLWRASVVVWREADDDLTAGLGPKYNELFRKFLMGEEGFPEDAAIWISVTRTRTPELICIGPHLHGKGTSHQFEMQIFGIRWSVFVGQRIDSVTRRMCTLRFPERFVYLSDSPLDLAKHGFENFARTARIAPNLRKAKPAVK